MEEAYDPHKAEVDVFKFLTLLYESSREDERKAADDILSEALEAVTDYGEDSEGDVRQSSLYRIDV